MPRRMSAERIALRQLAYELYVTMPKLSVRVLARLLPVHRAVLGWWMRRGRWWLTRQRYWCDSVTHMLLDKLRMVWCLRTCEDEGRRSATVHVAHLVADRSANYGRLLTLARRCWPGIGSGSLGALHEEPNTPRIDRSNARYYSRRAPLNKKPPL